MPTPPLLCNYTKDITVAPGGGLDHEVPIDGARDWTVLLDVSDGDLDTLSYHRSPLGDLDGPEIVVTGVPVADGEQAEIIETGSPLTSVHLVGTSASGCTVKIRAGGR